MKNTGRARYARRLAARSLIGALIVTAGLSGSIIGVAAGETLINGGEARPPDVTTQEHPATTSEKASKPKAAKKKRPRHDHHHRRRHRPAQTRLRTCRRRNRTLIPRFAVAGG